MQRRREEEVCSRAEEQEAGPGNSAQIEVQASAANAEVVDEVPEEEDSLDFLIFKGGVYYARI